METLRGNYPIIVRMRKQSSFLRPCERGYLYVCIVIVLTRAVVQIHGGTTNGTTIT